MSKKENIINEIKKEMELYNVSDMININLCEELINIIEEIQDTLYYKIGAIQMIQGGFRNTGSGPTIASAQEQLKLNWECDQTTLSLLNLCKKKEEEALLWHWSNYYNSDKTSLYLFLDIFPYKKICEAYNIPWQQYKGR